MQQKFGGFQASTPSFDFRNLLNIPVKVFENVTASEFDAMIAKVGDGENKLLVAEFKPPQKEDISELGKET